MTDHETLKTYAAKADVYADMVQNLGPEEPLLKSFLESLPQSVHVLDLGCGPGQFSAAIAAQGHQVTALDAVQEMVDLAGMHEGVDARLASFDEVSGEAVYDGIWANFSLLHAPRDAMPRHLVALHKALKPGGVFHIALKSGEGSKRDDLGRFYTYYTDAELAGLLMEAGFTVTTRTHGSGRGLDGVISDWIALSANG